MGEVFTSFLISVIAGVVHRNEQENPQSCRSEGFLVAYGNLPVSLAMFIICQSREKIN